MNLRLPWIIFFLSAALLGFQLALMRILSYMQWHHYAFMIISIALLGFGASGTLLFFFREPFLRHKNGVIFVFSLLSVAGLAGAPQILSFFSIDPFLLVYDPIRFLSLFALYLVCILPFFCGAVVIGFSFVLAPETAGRLYFFNLLGSGCGSLITVIAMNWIEPTGLPIALAFAALPAPLLACLGLQRRRTAWLLASCILLLTFALLPPPPLTVSQFKGLSKTLLLPDARVRARRTGPLGVIETVESRSLRYAPGMSLTYPGNIPSQTGVFSDAEWVGSILDLRDSSSLKFLKHSTSAFPYCLKRYQRAAVLGAGTGTELQLALARGVHSATGIEQNRTLVELLGSEYAPQTNSLTSRADVLYVVSEARSYLSRSKELYDLIVVPILEGSTSSASGVQALFENYLFTVEGVRVMLDQLRNDGVLVMTGWMTSPPRGSIKTLATMIRAMKQSGIDPASSFAGIRSWGTFSLLAKRGPFTEMEIAAMRNFGEENGFDLIYVPGIKAQETNRYHRLERPFLYEATAALLTGNEETLFDTSPFDVRPATDQRPYFSHFFRWKSLPQLLEMYTTGQVAFFELGYIFLIVTFAQLVILSAGLILVPLLRARTSLDAAKGLKRTLLYFGGIGVGYMMIEMVMIQKFILFLGHPVYSVAAITASLLVFSGIGSLASGRVLKSFGGLARPLLALLFIITLYGVFLSSLLSGLLWMEFLWRVLACIAIIAPLGFLMGLPFPLGLQQIAGASGPLIPWAWGINGYCSVVSVSLATLISIELGFAAVSVCALMSYAVALWSMTLTAS